MGLSVIGAGFGRTGTMSLKLALERLGFGPCHHMVEVIGHPAQAPLWRAAAEGKPVDWGRLFTGYASAVDWPACHFWRALAVQYPEAKFVLTVRDADAWYRSVAGTILKVMQGVAADPDPQRRAVMEMATYIVGDRTFGGRMDEDHVKAVFRRHNEAVAAALPEHRLLVCNAADGWGPLCAFLTRPVPDEPFPRTNSTAEFWEHIANPRP
jgi:hypothetical protein